MALIQGLLPCKQAAGAGACQRVSSCTSIAPIEGVLQKQAQGCTQHLQLQGNWALAPTFSSCLIMVSTDTFSLPLVQASSTCGGERG